jgi:hypothetical protein
MPPSWASDTVTVIRREVVGQDDRGNDRYDDVPVPYFPCRVQPVTTSEDDNNAVRVTSQWRVYGPPGMVVDADDRVTWGGREFEVDGDPEHWRSPTGARAHTEIVLRRVTG